MHCCLLFRHPHFRCFSYFSENPSFFNEDPAQSLLESDLSTIAYIENIAKFHLYNLDYYRPEDGSAVLN